MIKGMNSQKEHILLVETDPEISDLISRQTLNPLGYRVEVVGTASSALQEAMRLRPDVILADLTLPGLSGKDLLVALTSQGVDTPIIVIAPKGMESDVIQAFRLGAVDFLTWPIREAEVVSAVERVLRQGRARRERELLARQLNQTNQELQRRVRELTTIFAIGKAVISITDQQTLFDKILEGGAFVTEADSGWLLSRDERSKSFILRACRNVPADAYTRLNQPFDDGISSLVALSGEALSIHGEPLKRFKVARIGQSALVVPIKVKKEVVGLLVAARKEDVPFTSSQQALLEALADYASISLVNTHLFRALEDRLALLQQSATTYQLNERIQKDILQSTNKELALYLGEIKHNLDRLAAHETGKLSPESGNAFHGIQDRLGTIQDIVDATTRLQRRDSTKGRIPINLSELTHQAVNRYQPIAQQSRSTIQAKIPPKPVVLTADAAQISGVLDGLLSNAIKFSQPGASISVQVEISSNIAHISVQDSGAGISAKLLPHIFDAVYPFPGSARVRFGGAGIRLPLMKEIIDSHGGKMWVDSKSSAGCTFHITLPGASQ